MTLWGSSFGALAGCESDAGMADPRDASTDAFLDAFLDASALDVGPTDLGPADLDGGAREDGGADAGTAAAPCDVFSDPSRSGVLSVGALDETSGVVASRTHPGLLYAHNDSGDSARFFALDASGALRAEYALTGASFRDLEDIALGPCPAGTCVFLADTGDNDARSGGPNPRAEVSIYRVAEPTTPRFGAPPTTPLGGWERLRFVYPNAPFDCEAFMVDPETGDFYLITKVSGGVSPVFHAPAPHLVGSPTTLTQIGSITFGSSDAPGNPLSTAADFDTDGARILLRTYSTLLLWTLAPLDGPPAGLSRAEWIGQTLGGQATSLPAAGEPQGEAAAFVPGGVLTLSEGVSQPLWFSAEDCE